MDELRSPVTGQIDYSPDEVQFLTAMDRYKRENRRPYPTWREVLAVLVSLGYRKSEEAAPPPRFVRHENSHSGRPSSDCPPTPLPPSDGPLAAT
jgi:hypothetical protein